MPKDTEDDQEQPKCSVCDKNAEYLRRLYYYSPDTISLCRLHDIKLFSMGERFFLKIYQKNIGTQYNKGRMRKHGSSLTGTN
jgi:hypothetical protein